MTLKSLKDGELSLLNKSNIFQIKPTFSPTEQDDSSFDLFLVSIEQFIEKLLPKNILEDLINFPSEKTIEKAFRELNYKLPVFNYSFSTKLPHTISVGLLCLSEYTSGVGRYLNDMMSRWLIPGKHLPVVSCRSIEFYFTKCPKYQYYLHENYVRISNEYELSLVKNKISNYLNELRINILAVSNARYVVSIKSLSYDEKNAMIQENISSLLKIPNNFIDQNLFDQMQNLLIKTSSDEKIKEVEKGVSHLMHKRPKFFNRDIFYEIRDLLFQLKDQFIFGKNAKYLSRIIGYQYLFKKTILRKLNQTPNDRHLSLKLFKARQDGTSLKYVIGILFTMNLLSETERFEKKHILEAIRSILVDVQYVKHSYFSDRNNENIRSFYFEIKKNNDTRFNFEDIKKLRAKLPKEIKSRIENVVHSTFMPRNEEEIIRNIVILSKQLKYVKDIPQVIITYNKQTSTQLSFTIILVRLLKNSTTSLNELFEEDKKKLQFIQDEVKIVGHLKKKYPKEANIFRVFVDKYAFFRPNYSLNLQKARQYIVSELIAIIGDFRDYNGGMILKQHETLAELRNLLSEAGYEGHYLIENFFYSLKPGIMQSILTPKILKTPFLMLHEAVENDYEKKQLFISYSQDCSYLFLTVGSENSSFKIFIKNSLSQLNISSLDLTSSTLKVYDIYITSYIFKSHDKPLKDIFLKTILKALSLWENSYIQHIKDDLMNDKGSFD
jgi:hypothetical protein